MKQKNQLRYPSTSPSVERVRPRRIIQSIHPTSKHQPHQSIPSINQQTSTPSIIQSIHPPTPAQPTCQSAQPPNRINRWIDDSNQLESSKAFFRGIIPAAKALSGGETPDPWNHEISWNLMKSLEIHASPWKCMKSMKSHEIFGNPWKSMKKQPAGIE